MTRVILCVLLLGTTVVSAAAENIWPAKDWARATPKSRGLADEAIDEAAAYAQRHGGGSGCVVRHGFLVREWGDPSKLADIKSCTKGAVGATALGLAVDSGLVGLDDRALDHYAGMGQEKGAESRPDWLGEVTVRHLATMTAGFDDGRPPKLTYRPGTRGIYSNDTSNMLAELLTLKFREDLAEVFRRRVMDVIDAPADEWRWRENQFRAKEINGLKSREFASGIRITHRTLARIGYLYLRNGIWDGKRVLSEEFIKAATTPTELPGPFPYYAIYWASNQRGTYAGMPKDTYWALGLGDSFVVVCPSLDLVAVRLGTGSKASQLPGGDEDWGARVEGFFKIVAGAVIDGPARRSEQSPPTAAAAPYPPSPVIRSIEWAPAHTIVRAARGSDNWPLTWADDDALYGAYGDGNGFDPKVPRKLSLGLAKITRGAPEPVGENLPSPSAEQFGDGASGRKASGMLMVDGTLYLWARNAGNSQLAWSADRGRSWDWADWKFTTSFGCPTFLNFGRNYAGARDGFVYVYSHDSDSAYEPADRMVLARVPKDLVKDRAGYEFFQRIDTRGEPVWTRNIAERGAVFVHRMRCYRSSISYNPGLKRYLWWQVVPGKDPRFAGGFGVYDAPEPWGPWTTAHFTEAWDVGPGESGSFPTKWINPDGRTIHLVFSGDDCFSVRKATLAVANPQPSTGADVNGMTFPGAAWPEATPQSQGVDPTPLGQAVGHLEKQCGRDGVRQLVIVRNGRIIWKGDDVDRVHGVWSVTKSFTGTCLGLLVADGKCSLDTPARDYVPDLAARYPSLTLRHFATMTSGYRASGDEPRGGYLHGPSRTPFVPAEPLFAPGEKYAYWDSAMNEFGRVLTKIAGEPLEDLFRRRVAGPIGMDPENWDWGDFGAMDGVVVNGGAGNHGKHVRVSALELARFGHLFLNGGNWAGRRVLDPGWVSAATRAAVPADTRLGHPESKIDGRGVYGLTWWVNAVGAGGTRKWPAAPPGTFAAVGFNNNHCFVIPEWRMVVVRLGTDGNVPEGAWDTFFKHLSPGVSP